MVFLRKISLVFLTSMLTCVKAMEQPEQKNVAQKKVFYGFHLSSLQQRCLQTISENKTSGEVLELLTPHLARVPAQGLVACCLDAKDDKVPYRDRITALKDTARVLWLSGAKEYACELHKEAEARSFSYSQIPSLSVLSRQIVHGMIHSRKSHEALINKIIFLAGQAMLSKVDVQRVRIKKLKMVDFCPYSVGYNVSDGQSNEGDFGLALARSLHKSGYPNKAKKFLAIFEAEHDHHPYHEKAANFSSKDEGFLGAHKDLMAASLERYVAWNRLSLWAEEAKKLLAESGGGLGLARKTFMKDEFTEEMIFSFPHKLLDKNIFSRELLGIIMNPGCHRDKTVPSRIANFSVQWPLFSGTCEDPAIFQLFMQRGAVITAPCATSCMRWRTNTTCLENFVWGIGRPHRQCRSIVLKEILQWAHNRLSADEFRMFINTDNLMLALFIGGNWESYGSPSDTKSYNFAMANMLIEYGMGQGTFYEWYSRGYGDLVLGVIKNMLEPSSTSLTKILLDIVGDKAAPEDDMARVISALRAKEFFDRVVRDEDREQALEILKKNGHVKAASLLEK